VVGAEVLEFIQRSFKSAWNVELLLQLRREPERFWSHQELKSVLRASDSIIKEGLLVLDVAGLIKNDVNLGSRYAPQNEQLDRLTMELEQIYKERREVLMRLLYPNQKLSAFADAFRIRKDR
jgi:hypothetical protein